MFYKGQDEQHKKKKKPQISGICFSPQLETNDKLKKKN